MEISSPNKSIAAFTVLRRARLNDGKNGVAVRVIQEPLKNHHAVVFVTDDGSVGWCGPEQLRSETAE